MPCLAHWYRCHNCDHLIYGRELNNAQCRICVGGWLYPVPPLAGGTFVPDIDRACSFCGCAFTDDAPLDHLCPLCGEGLITLIEEKEIWVSREEVLKQQSKSATTAAMPTIQPGTTSSESPGENITSSNPTTNSKSD
jgi:hypothetical protein